MGVARTLVDSPIAGDDRESEACVQRVNRAAANARDGRKKDEKTSDCVSRSLEMSAGRF
jgi:hypothetical protein